MRKTKNKHGLALVSARRLIRPCLEVLEDRLTPSTYTVTDASDAAGSSTDVTLRYAITQAISAQDTNAGIDFSSSLASQTITLSLTDSSTTYGPTAFVVQNANITIDGSGASGLVISGGNTLRPFAVESTGTLILENLTVTDGSAKGGDGGSSQFGGSGGAGLGGAVFDDGGTFTAEGVTFTNNSATGGAPGLPDTSTSQVGGGGGGMGVAGQSGSAGGAGGGSGGSSNTAGFAGGFGGGGGGGGSSGAGGAGGFGGGGSSGAGGGSPGFGGGFGAPGGTKGGAGGGGGGLGGALFSNGGTLTLTNDTFTANNAVGGIVASGLGGAVFARNGTVTATFDTFSSNTANQGGSDVYILSDGSGSQATATLIDDILGQTSNTNAINF